MKSIQLRFETYLFEAKKNFKILTNDFVRIKKFLPLNSNIIERLLKDEDMLLVLDQIAFRYIKLQDIMGKLLRSFFLIKGENIEELTIIDIVNLAEKKNLPISEQEWMELRFLRNSITHEYSNDFNDIAISINKLNNFLPTIERFLIKIEELY